MLNPSPSNSPSLTSQDFNNSRKRLRSLSLESESSSSSPKRSMSQDPTPDVHDTPRPNDLPTPPTEDVPMISDSDAQSESQTSLTPAPIPPLAAPATPSGSSSVTVTPKDKYDKVVALAKRDMVVGETWYVVSRRWYKRWEKACTGIADKEGSVEEKDIGPVDNSHLVDSKGNLTNNLTEDVDIQFVPEEAWELLVEWYGQSANPVPRKVITRGKAQVKSLELFPPKLYAHFLLPGGNSGSWTPHPPVEVVVSAVNKLSDICEALFKAVCPDTKDTEYRIWELPGEPANARFVTLQQFEERQVTTLLQPSDTLMEESFVDDTNCYVVEVHSDGKWVVPEKGAEESKTSQPTQPVDGTPKPLFTSGSDFFSKMSSKSTAVAQVSKPVPAPPPRDPRPAPKVCNLTPGTLGLGNMGNTCFMNSAIQCLVHTPELAEYFLTGVFEKELNPDNPLGMHGAIAQAFGSLLKRIWSPTSPATSYSPRDFKSVLARFAPQFSGYQQHDSQELVAFLLDGLHEDLNRVLKKPYVEKPDWEGGGDKALVALAQESWKGYMKRNDSVIVDLFQGQYQSTLVCPECNKVSITFDPFMYLTLPLPVQKKWKHDVFYIPWDVEKPHLKVAVEINRDSSFKDLRVLLGKWFDTNPENLVVLDIFNSRFYKNLDDNILVNDMSDNDVVACYELPCHSQQSRGFKRSAEDPVIMPVYLVEPPARHRTTFGSASPTYFGYPFLVVVGPEEAKSLDAIYDLVVDRLQRWTVQVRDLYQWEAGTISTPMEEVPISLSPNPVLESVTEIKENGDVVTVQEAAAPEEGDIVDEKNLVIQEQDYESMDTGDDSPRQVGFKRDIFQLLAHSNGTQYCCGYSTAAGSKSESLELRVKEADEENPYLIHDGEAILAQFDEHTKAYYFGEPNKFEHARWALWEEFVHPELKASREVALQKKTRGISLQDCLDEFTKEEQLGEDDLWYCPRCKKHQQATKRFDLWSVPDVLVVHLKRFSNSRILRDKIDTFVDFPLTGLDLTSMAGVRKAAQNLAEAGEDLPALGLEDTEDPLIYDLFAVDEHLGGLGGGHYRAYAFNAADQKWYHFDDSYVTAARAEAAVNANAYLLFYRRRTTRPLGGKTHDIVKDAREAVAQVSEVSEGATEAKNEESRLPTPPVDDDIISPSFEKLPSVDSIIQSIRPGELTAWRPAPHSDRWDNSPSSQADSPPPLDDIELPSFEASQLDPLVASNLTPLELSAPQFDFPDPTSRGSPSSVQAEFDQDACLDLDSFDTREEIDSWYPAEVEDSLSQDRPHKMLAPNELVESGDDEEEALKTVLIETRRVRNTSRNDL